MKVEIMDNRTAVEFKEIAVGECFQASSNLYQPFMKVKEIAGIKRNCVNLTTGTLSTYPRIKPFCGWTQPLTLGFKPNA